MPHRAVTRALGPSRDLWTLGAIFWAVPPNSGQGVWIPDLYSSLKFGVLNVSPSEPRGRLKANHVGLHYGTPSAVRNPGATQELTAHLAVSAASMDPSTGRKSLYCVISAWAAHQLIRTFPLSFLSPSFFSSFLPSFLPAHLPSLLCLLSLFPYFPFFLPSLPFFFVLFRITIITHSPKK